MDIAATYSQSTGAICEEDGSLKRCSGCGLERPRTEYYARSDRKSGIQSICKECTKKQNREWLSKNREYKSSKGRKHYRENKDYWKDTKLRYKYGISLDEYRRLLASQGGVCAICGKTDSTGRELAVDHNHATGAVRGLLCGKCNTALGSVFEDISVLNKMIDYIGGHIDNPSV